MNSLLAKMLGKTKVLFSTISACSFSVVSNCAVLRDATKPELIFEKPAKYFHEELASVDSLAEAKRMHPVQQKTARKWRPLTSRDNECQSFIGPQVVSIASGDSFDLLSALKDPQIQLIYQHKNIDNDAEAGLHFSLKPEYLVKSNKIREFFLFNDGVVVFWGLDQVERSQILRLLRKYINNPYDSKLVEEEIESMSFLITNEDETCIKNDRFLINIQKHETEFNSSKSILERYAFSHGMATSVKIAIWESQLSERAEILAITTKALSEGYIPWKRKEVLKLIGYFSDLRHSINLNCDLLSTDFYWENEHLENFYDQAIKHFMVRKRMRLLNNRLDYCEDLVKLIDGMLAHRHASTLEWMIIILIVIEVIFDILHFFENSFYEKLLKRIDSSDRYDK